MVRCWKRKHTITLFQRYNERLVGIRGPLDVISFLYIQPELVQEAGHSWMPMVITRVIPIHRLLPPESSKKGKQNSNKGREIVHWVSIAFVVTIGHHKSGFIFPPKTHPNARDLTVQNEKASRRNELPRHPKSRLCTLICFRGSGNPVRPETILTTYNYLSLTSICRNYFNGDKGEFSPAAIEVESHLFCGSWPQNRTTDLKISILIEWLDFFFSA